MLNTPIEIERKFLITMPSIETLESAEGSRKKEITQIYLTSINGETTRVRKIAESGNISYIKTTKKRISDLSHFEDEFEITHEEYENELKNRDESKANIQKTRYCIPFCNHILEIDIYPFWSDRAILEIELTEENEEFNIPDFINVIKEVSADKRYKNTNLALQIPMDDIQLEK